MKARNEFTSDKECLEYLLYYYSGLAMQANSDNEHETPEMIAENSVKLAKALIAELNKTEV